MFLLVTSILIIILCNLWLIYRYFFTSYSSWVNFLFPFKMRTWVKPFFWLILFFILNAFFFLLRWSLFDNNIEKAAVDKDRMLFILDVSRSMDVEDVWWTSRLEHAKQEMISFIEHEIKDKSNVSVWLIVYSWVAFTAVPFTYEYDFFLDILKEISSSTIAQQESELQGSALWDALLLARSTFSSDENNFSFVFLFSDWWVLQSFWEITDIARTFVWDWVMMSIVGVWSKEWGDLALQTPLWLFNKRLPWVDSDFLQKLSEVIGWSYSINTLDAGDFPFSEKKHVLFSYFQPSWWIVYGLFFLLLFLTVLECLVFYKKWLLTSNI